MRMAELKKHGTAANTTGATQAAQAATAQETQTKASGETCPAELLRIDPKFKGCMDRMYNVPARVLDKLWLAVGSAGTAVAAVPDHLIGTIPYTSEIFPPMIFASVVLGVLKGDIIRKETVRRADKVLRKVEKHVNNGSMKTYIAVAAILQVEDLLEAKNARGNMNRTIASACDAVLQKLDEGLSYGKIDRLDAAQQFSSLVGMLTLNEQESIGKTIMAVRNKCFQAATAAAD